MFDLDIAEETAAVFTLCRSLGQEVAYPAARGAERDAAIPEHLRGALFDIGLLAPVDERFGGGGRPTAPTQCAAVEALAYGDPGLTMAAVWSGAVTEILAMVGTEGQQAAVLPRFASDPMAHGALALYEGHGRAPSESTTTVSRTGGGQWLVRGTKLAVAGAQTADPLIVVGTDPADGRIRLVMMRPGQLGVEIADPQRHIGLDAARLSTVTLDATVDDAALVGGVDADPDRVDVALSRVRLLLATAMLGTAQRSVDYASKYATERVAFGNR